MMLYGLTGVLVTAAIAYELSKPGLFSRSKPLQAIETVSASESDVARTDSMTISKSGALAQRRILVPDKGPSQSAPAPAAVTAPETWSPAGLDASPTGAQDRPAVLETRKLDPDEIKLLMQRGQQLVASGDLASARVVFQRAAEAGDAAAALAIGSTYDPTVLAKFGMRGPTADAAKARAWYQRAQEFGSPEAARQLELLEHRESRIH